MFMRLAALAACVVAPCAFAQVATTPVPPVLTLEAAIDRVAAIHPDLQLPRLQRDAALARVEAAGLAPPLILGVELENALGSGQARGLDQAELTVTLAGVLERGGKLDARRTLAQANLDALAPQREIARLDLMAEVARRYLAVTATNTDLQIAQADIVQRRRAVDASRVRLQAGASPQASLLAAEAALAQSELDRDRAQQAGRAARVALAVLWNGSQEDVVDVSGDPLRLPDVAPFQELAALLARTPELAALAGQERVREAQLRLARSQQRSDLDWQLGVRHARDSGDTSLVGGLSLALGGARRAAPDIAAARAELMMSPLERQSRQMQLQATLAQAHGEYVTSRLEVQRLGSDVLPRMRNAEAAAAQAWRAGAISYLELAQLQALRVEAMQRQRDAAIGAQTALIEIQRLTGQPLTGLRNEETP